MHKNHDYFAPQYEVMARVKTAIRLSGLTLAQLCQRAGVSMSDVQQACERFDENPQAHSHTLHKLEASLQITHGALTGLEELPLTKSGRSSLLEKTLKLMWQYIYKAEVPKARWAALEAELRRRIDSLRSASPTAMYRAGVPTTWEGVGGVYRALFGEGQS